MSAMKKFRVRVGRATFLEHGESQSRGEKIPVGAYAVTASRKIKQEKKNEQGALGRVQYNLK